MYGTAAARSNNKTIDSLYQLGKVDVLLAAGTINTLDLGSCPWNLNPLAQRLVWISKNINEKLESKSNRLPAVW